MAVNFPKGGETILKIVPEIKYHMTIANGPLYPTSSDNFLENKIISRVGFEKFE
jgi:hypothetical protein